MIDFGSLDLRSALDFAIGVEEDAQLRYQEHAASVTEPDAAQFFRNMARAEREHRRQLEARRDVLFRHHPARFDTSVADELEGLEPEGVETRISAREALEVALRAEVRSYEFYASAIPHLKDPDVRAFFEELKREELGHQAELRQRIKALASGADERVA